ncbi:hypothetical protein, partial [Escherichia coli]|uniref:hypothetical protein n=1 Tax=Escherichia coli TaxID=562 RepID=UPI001AECC7E6
APAQQNKSTIVRLRSFVCIADDAPEKRVNMSSPEYYNSLIQYDDPAAWTEQEQLLKQMTVENVNTAVKQYLSHPVNTYTGVLLPK